MLCISLTYKTGTHTQPHTFSATSWCHTVQLQGAFSWVLVCAYCWDAYSQSQAWGSSAFVYGSELWPGLIGKQFWGGRSVGAAKSMEVCDFITELWESGSLLSIPCEWHSHSAQPLAETRREKAQGTLVCPSLNCEPRSHSNTHSYWRIRHCFPVQRRSFFLSTQDDIGQIWVFGSEHYSSCEVPSWPHDHKVAILLGTRADQEHMIRENEMGRFLDHLICTAKNSVGRAGEDAGWPQASSHRNSWQPLHNVPAMGAPCNNREFKIAPLPPPLSPSEGRQAHSLQASCRSSLAASLRAALQENK